MKPTVRPIVLIKDQHDPEGEVWYTIPIDTPIPHRYRLASNYKNSTRVAVVGEHLDKTT